jgi:segregation and condensation protein B
LSRFGFATLRDLPDMEKLEDAGLLSKERLIAGDLHNLFGVKGEDEERNEAEDDEDQPSAA